MPRPISQQQPVDPDALYQSYDRGLYRITGEEATDSMIDIINADIGKNNSQNVTVSASDVGSGVDTSTSTSANGSYQAGKKTFDNVDKGFILGFDPKDGNAKFYIGNTTNYLNWTGTSLVVAGSLSAVSIDVPNTTTANSFHVDSTGNTWWGANVATGYAGANAYVLNTGVAVFKSPQIGGASTQYVVNDSGMSSFGDGSDGAATFDGSATPAGTTKSASDYTLTRDVYYTNATFSTATSLNPAGYRIFGSGVLTLNGTAVILRNGKDGAAGVNGQAVVLGGAGGTGGAGGAALADGYLKGSPAGGAGGTGGASVSGAGVSGTAGTTTTNSIGSQANSGGNGGAGGGGGGGAGPGAAGGAATQSNVKLIANWHLATLLDIGSTGTTIKFDNSGSGGGGGGGGAGTGGAAGGGGGGGGGGSPGGIVAIYFRSIIIGASASITANGGNGGNGGNGDPSGTKSGGGGGGAGGNGGQVILVYNILTNSGSITANGGNPGTGGTGSVAGTNGVFGSNEPIRQFQLSL